MCRRAFITETTTPDLGIIPRLSFVGVRISEKTSKDLLTVLFVLYTSFGNFLSFILTLAPPIIADNHSYTWNGCRAIFLTFFVLIIYPTRGLRRRAVYSQKESGGQVQFILRLLHHLESLGE